MKKITLLLFSCFIFLAGCEVNWGPLKEFLLNSAPQVPQAPAFPGVDKLSEFSPIPSPQQPTTNTPAPAADIAAAIPVKPVKRLTGQEVAGLFGDQANADQINIRTRILNFRTDNNQTIKDAEELFGPEVMAELTMVAASYERTLFTQARRCTTLEEYLPIEKAIKQKMEAATSAVLTKYINKLNRR